MSEIHTDQIWVKTNCAPIDIDTKKYFDSIAQELKLPGVLTHCIDQVPDKYINMPHILTDNVLKGSYIPLWPEFWGLYYYESEHVNRMPTRFFSCFMNRVCPIRQSWLYQFVRRGLFEQGSISFRLDRRYMPNSRNFASDKDFFEWIFEQHGAIFAKEHEFLRPIVPYCNFSGDLDQVMVDVKLNLIIETYFEATHLVAFSEKVFRAIQLPRPMMIYGNPGSVNALRAVGFDVFDDVIDHSYDNELDPIKRQIIMLDQLESLQNMCYTNETLEEYGIRARHNRDLLKQYKDNWPGKLEKVAQELEQISKNRVAGSTSM